MASQAAQGRTFDRFSEGDALLVRTVSTVTKTIG
jgi:hypothetical protein